MQNIFIALYFALNNIFFLIVIKVLQRNDINLQPVDILSARARVTFSIILIKYYLLQIISVGEKYKN